MPGIRVEMTLEGKQFRGELRENERATERFEKKAGGRFKALGDRIFNLKGLLAGLGAAFTLRGITSLISSSAEFADSIGKLSKNLGVTTEFLSEMRFAAEQSGIEFGSFSMAIERAIRNIEEFRATGKGPAGDAIEALGIGELVKQGAELEELLPIIADRFNELGSNAERVRVTYLLFGRDSARLNTLFREGSEGIKELRLEARALGATLSQDATRKAEDYNDAVNRLSTSWRGLKQAMAEAIQPSVTTFINEITESLKKSQEAADKATTAWQENQRRLLDTEKTIQDAIRGAEQVGRTIDRKIRERGGPVLGPTVGPFLPPESVFKERDLVRRLIDTSDFERRLGGAVADVTARERAAAMGPGRAATPSQEPERLRGFEAALARIQERAEGLNVIEDSVLSLANSLESLGGSIGRDLVTNFDSLEDVGKRALNTLAGAVGELAGRIIALQAIAAIPGLGGVVTAQHGFSGRLHGPARGFLVPMMLHGPQEQVEITPAARTSERPASAGGGNTIILQLQSGGDFREQTLENGELITAVVLDVLGRNPEAAPFVRGLR